MSKEKTCYNVYTYCSLGKFEQAQKILISYDNIDILYENGSFFTFAIAKNNLGMLSTLLQYYEKLQIQPDTVDYRLAKHKLYEILQDAIDTFDISEEMKEVLAPYLKDAEDSVRDDLSDLPTWQTEGEFKDDFYLNNKNNTEFKRTYSVQDLSEEKITFLNEKSSHFSEKKTSDVDNFNDITAMGKNSPDNNEFEQ